jgi:hypothetical protein
LTASISAFWADAGAINPNTNASTNAILGMSRSSCNSAAIARRAATQPMSKASLS